MQMLHVPSHTRILERNRHQLCRGHSTDSGEPSTTSDEQTSNQEKTTRPFGCSAAGLRHRGPIMILAPMQADLLPALHPHEHNTSISMPSSLRHVHHANEAHRNRDSTGFRHGGGGVPCLLSRSHRPRSMMSNPPPSDPRYSFTYVLLRFINNQVPNGMPPTHSPSSRL